MTDRHATDDLGLALPLHGVQWIEASAGTGKTFLLATLYSRLVVEAGWPVASLLAVTFTEAATQELRERLRERLVLARDLAAGEVDGDENEAHRLTAALVAVATEREGRAFLLRRLRLAVEAMDVAPIFTIHGFCRRALADHALEAGQPMVERAIVENENALREEVATDFWRRCNTDAGKMSDLRALWKSPKALAKDLRDLLTIDTLLPLPSSPGRSRQEIEQVQAASRHRLAFAFREHGATARAQLSAALAAGAINKTVVKDEAVDPIWQALSDWLAHAEREDPDIGKLGNYGKAKLRSKLNKNGAMPDSPLFDAIDDWFAFVEMREAQQRQSRVALAHEARDYARTRLDAIKRERGLIGYDDMVRGVADALDGPQGESFARKLRRQYGVALVDEFQDTDPRQWRIFRELFARRSDHASDDDDLFGDNTPLANEAPRRARALFLIGDPKQAIYRFRGGDVYAYLEARAEADAWHALSHNFRSRPSAIAAVSTLFAGAGPQAFAESGIEYLPVLPGGRIADEDFRVGDAVPAAIEVARLPNLQEAGIDAARDAATTACVARLHALLSDAIAGRVLRRSANGGWRSLGAGDIAVLVERNDDADRIRDALALAGIPCVAAGRRSLFETDEAADLRCLLHALLAPADESRLRAALATPLLGLDAASIRCLDEDESARRAWADRLQLWRARAERQGPLAAVNAACAGNAARLLGLVDGERRLTNYLQLGEELQASAAARLGPRALVDELERRMAEADAQNDAELLRLESDASRVKILTLHKSKGLEFDVVFLPYVGIRTGDPPGNALKLARFHDGSRRVAELFADDASPANAKEEAEQFAEKIRLLYVGLTRARLSTWMAWGAVKEAGRTPLAWLLHRDGEAKPAAKLSPESIEAGLAQWQQRAAEAGAPEAVRILPAASERPTQRLRFDTDVVTPDAAIARRQFTRDWWVYSFSQLSREDDGAAPLESGGAGDEIQAPIPLSPSRFVGSRFGNTLHAALETVDFAAWRDWSGDLPPPGEFDKLVRALNDEGFGSEADHREGLPLLTHLVAATLNARLPEGARLCELPPTQRRAELEFHLAFAPVAMPALLATLHRHGIVGDRQAFGLRQRIEGLLTGFIDLVYEHEGRFHVLDYKSNQLPDYSPIGLQASVRDHEYDLQYTLYTLALHRWLRFRLGSAYDYDRQMGGVRYLYCRGLDPEQPGRGMHALTLPRVLVEELDALFAPAPGLLAEGYG